MPATQRASNLGVVAYVGTRNVFLAMEKANGGHPTCFYFRSRRFLRSQSGVDSSLPKKSSMVYSVRSLNLASMWSAFCGGLQERGLHLSLFLHLYQYHYRLQTRKPTSIFKEVSRFPSVSSTTPWRSPLSMPWPLAASISVAYPQCIVTKSGDIFL